ncbi:TetR/AcrR family transcriptional regulator [Nocardia fluminea]|uniref:TetR/AcrR family transcriptional regulator n=1 Tax=Nocardia fluminea TaxID=134984 RepID=UPI0034164FEE
MHPLEPDRTRPTRNTHAGRSGGLAAIKSGGHADESVVLDAALEVFIDFGIKRTTMRTLAQRAGIGLATLYRRYPGKSAVVEAVLDREARCFLAAVAAQVDPSVTAEYQLADGFAAGIALLAAHPLLQRLLAIEPEAVHGRIFAADSELLAIGRTYVAENIRHLQRRGELLGTDPDVTAEILIRLALTLVLHPSGAIPAADPIQTRSFARRHLAKLVSAS